MLLGIAAIAFLGAMVTTTSASPKRIQNIKCEGELMSAHTLTVGNCSFTGSPAKKVYARCKEDILCYVLGRGWNNHNGMFIIEQVITVEEVPVD
jgi:hypothetical protein